jgi:hypothetical protein
MVITTKFHSDWKVNLSVPAELLGIVSEIMAGERNIALLDEILSQWK